SPGPFCLGGCRSRWRMTSDKTDRLNSSPEEKDGEDAEDANVGAVCYASLRLLRLLRLLHPSPRSNSRFFVYTLNHGPRALALAVHRQRAPRGRDPSARHRSDPDLSGRAL